jgi:hypothetical protein
MSAKPWEDDASSSKPSPSKAPVLPWMRVPITIKPGSGVGVDNLPGLQPNLAAALRNRKYQCIFHRSAAYTGMTSSLDIKMFEIFGAYDKSIFKHL